MRFTFPWFPKDLHVSCIDCYPVAGTSLNVPYFPSWLSISPHYLRHPNSIAKPSIQLQVFHPEAFFTLIPHINSTTIPHCSSLKTLCLCHAVIFNYPEIRPTICLLWTLYHAGFTFHLCYKNIIQKFCHKCHHLIKLFQNQLWFCLLCASLIFGSSFVTLILFYSMCQSDLLETNDIKLTQTGWNNKIFNWKVKK